MDAIASTITDCDPCLLFLTNKDPDKCFNFRLNIFIYCLSFGQVVRREGEGKFGGSVGGNILRETN